MSTEATRLGLSPSDIRSAYPELRRLLITRMTELLPRQDSARAHLDEQVMSAPGDEADASVLDTSADYFLALANSHQRELLEIREAFERMQRGVFGVCETCEDSIGIDRLRKLPYARLCIDCQSQVERNQAAAYPRARPKF